MNPSVELGFIVAMKEEADILASAIGLYQNKGTTDAYILYTNPEKTIIMITPGLDSRFLFSGEPISRVGKVSAAIITTILIETYRPGCIINTGTAGGIASENMEIGDIVVANFVVNHDIRIPLDGYREYGTRKIPMKNVDRLSFLSHPYKIGGVSSGESFANTPDEWKIIKQNKALVKEMEAGGVAQAAEILLPSLPLYIIKSVTDLGDEEIHAHTSSREFTKNFAASMAELSSVIKELVDNRTRILPT